MTRNLSIVDKFIVNADLALRTLVPNSASAARPNPAEEITTDNIALDEQERTHVAGLMRINHTGEVCAQALYQGQALTAKLPTVKKEMDQAAREEIDHLVWCEQRLTQLGSRTSVLNPLFYAASFSVGALAGLAGDKWSLGFVAATEDQVCEHLEYHLSEIPENDTQSRAILQQMLIDERAHGSKALEAGGTIFPEKVKTIMSTLSKLMTKTTYSI